MCEGGNYRESIRPRDAEWSSRRSIYWTMRFRRRPPILWGIIKLSVVSGNKLRICLSTLPTHRSSSLSSPPPLVLCNFLLPPTTPSASFWALNRNVFGVDGKSQQMKICLTWSTPLMWGHYDCFPLVLLLSPSPTFPAHTNSGHTH